MSAPTPKEAWWEWKARAEAAERMAENERAWRGDAVKAMQLQHDELKVAERKLARVREAAEKLLRSYDVSRFEGQMEQAAYRTEAIAELRAILDGEDKVA